MPFERAEFTVTKVGKRIYRLEKDMCYFGRADAWTVPAGSVTDYASVPAAVRWLFPSDDDYTQAAILHDWFCDGLNKAYLLDKARKEGRPTIAILVKPPVNARDADAIFRRVMRELGVPFLRRWAMWTGVRWGALVNPARREGIWQDLPKMLLISVMISPLVIPPSLFVVLGGLIDRVVNLLIGGFLD